MSSIDDLLRHPGLWRAREQGGATSQPAGLPTGYAALDRCLPGGGWPSQGLIEILTRSSRHRRTEPADARARRAVAARIMGTAGSPGSRRRTSRTHLHSPPAASTCGACCVVRAQPAEWAMEQALRSGACSAVLGWAALPRSAEPAPAAARGRAVALPGGAVPQAGAMAANLRPRCCASRSKASREGLEVRILKSRGGQAATVQLGWLGPAAHAIAH